MKHPILAAIVLLLLSNVLHASEVEIIRLSDGNRDHAVLSLALDATIEDFGPYQLKHHKAEVQGRAIEELANNRGIDVLWFATSAQREKRLHAIPIPIDMGMLGFRVCMIRKGSQAAFGRIRNLQGWRASGVSIGQHQHWPDTGILKANHLDVVTSQTYDALFQMLRAKRFDCFARSILEIDREMKELQITDLEIERNLLLVYPMPTFMFVSKQNIRLAKRLTQGLTRIQQDGRLKAVVLKQHEKHIEDLNLKQRRIIHLNNPELTKETRALLGSPSLWLDFQAAMP
ncbi:MAG: ABC transporter substrate-binding protein [Gammaproteobacteria bacterium]|nr:ABC transporter substrate-binding protein [Gammaproteobacteria bacterium]